MGRFNKVNKFLWRLNQVALLAILGVATYFVVSLIVIVHQTPARYLSFHVHEDTVVAGTALTYDFHFCRNVGEEVQTNVVQNLVPVDAHGSPLKGASPITLAVSPNVSAARGCQTAKNRQVIVPVATPAGCYKVHRIGQYYKLVGFKPSSVDIYSNRVCVSAPPAEQSVSTVTKTEIRYVVQPIDVLNKDGQADAVTPQSAAQVVQDQQPQPISSSSTDQTTDMPAPTMSGLSGLPLIGGLLNAIGL